MINLLSSLVDRTLERAPILQRRQPSLFEPVNDAAMMTRHDHFEDSLPQEETVALSTTGESVALAADRRTVEPRRGPFSDAPEQFTTPQRPVSTERSVTKKFVVGDTLAESEPSPLNADPTVTVEQLDHSFIRSVPAARQVGEPARLHPGNTVTFDRSIETIVESKVEHQVVFKNLAPEHGEEKISRPTPSVETIPQSISDKVVAGPRSAQKETPLRNDRTASIKPQGQTPTKELQRIRRTRLQPEPQQQAAQARPTINVTIGRVEVRATAPSRREPARAPNPKLSLEDYLRGRSKGN